jgi:hypothetical protein
MDISQCWNANRYGGIEEARRVMEGSSGIEFENQDVAEESDEVKSWHEIYTILFVNCIVIHSINSV